MAPAQRRARRAMLTFLALVCVAIAISGALAFAFFWPMSLVHLRDRHPAQLAAFGGFAFGSPAALLWLARGGYRALADRSLDGLATPARLSLWSMLLSLVSAGLLLLFARTL